MYGFYSADAASRFGTIVWERPDGTEVEVTAVSESQDYPRYEWLDKRCVGEVVKFLKNGRFGSFPIDDFWRL